MKFEFLIDDEMHNFFINFLSRSSSFVARWFAKSLNFGDKYCCYCDRRLLYFLAYEGVLTSFVKAMNVVGSDVDNHSCPKCQSHDRERHLKLYFQKLDINKLIKNNKILHFAPERYFSKYISDLHPALYVKADLFPASSDVQRVDMLKMDFCDDSFDFLIANHVLEHVADDSTALTELNRVLKPGGFALLQTPYSAVLSQKFEDDGIQTNALRLQAYGQEDHVRLYGRDFVKHVETFGFKSHIFYHDVVLAAFDEKKYGVNAKEPLFLFEKI